MCVRRRNRRCVLCARNNGGEEEKEKKEVSSVKIRQGCSEWSGLVVIAGCRDEADASCEVWREESFVPARSVPAWSSLARACTAIRTARSGSAWPVQFGPVQYGMPGPVLAGAGGMELRSCSERDRVQDTEEDAPVSMRNRGISQLFCGLGNRAVSEGRTEVASLSGTCRLLRRAASHAAGRRGALASVTLYAPRIRACAYRRGSCRPY